MNLKCMNRVEIMSLLKREGIKPSFIAPRGNRWLIQVRGMEDLMKMVDLEFEGKAERVSISTFLIG